VARDLMDREVAGSGHVDLLLPMAEGAEFGVTAPAPYLGLDRDSGFAPLEPEERSTSPIDLDLSLESDRPASIFDTLDPLDENSAAAKRR
jgi:pilus assembly protein FimV